MTREETARLSQELDQMVLSGAIMDAFEKFYADDVEMQENGGDPHLGKDVNRQREREFVDSVGEFHGAEVLSSAATDGTSFSEWMMDITFKGGPRKKLQQVAVRQWRNGQVVQERFYYDTAA